MTEAAIMFAKPGALKESDKTALHEVGVVVVEVDDPQSVKFVRAQTEVPAGDLLAAAAKAFAADRYGEVRQAFASAVAEFIILRHDEAQS